MDDDKDSGYVCFWPGAIGVLSNKDLTTPCRWTPELLLSAFSRVGIPTEIVPVQTLMKPKCTIVDICSDPALRTATGEDVQHMLHFLAAPDWCSKFWHDHQNVIWDASGICLYIRHHACWKAGIWTDSDVSGLKDAFGQRQWYSMRRSDILALATAAKTMTPVQKAVLVEATTESIRHTIRTFAPVLFDEENMVVLEDMVSAAHGSGILDDACIRGDLNNACLSYVLVSCGQHSVTMLEESPCRTADLHGFLTRLPLFVCSCKWSDHWCDAVYGSMEPTKVIDAYLESCEGQCFYCARRWSAAWRECIDAAFYKRWYLLHRLLHKRLTVTHM
jgi:hypothetical protein